MAMKNIMENFRNSLPEYDDKSLQEVETREGFRNYKITMYIKIDKKANIDVRQAFGKIRAIEGVTPLKQEKPLVTEVLTGFVRLPLSSTLAVCPIRIIFMTS